MKRYPKAMTLAEDVSHENKKSTFEKKVDFVLLNISFKRFTEEGDRFAEPFRIIGINSADPKSVSAV